MASEEGNYDCFLAHSDEDADTVDELMEELMSRGLRCNHHKYAFTPGETVLSNILDGIHSSKCVLLIMSPAFLKSRWTAIEQNVALLKSKLSGLVSTIAINVNILPTDPDYPVCILSMVYFTYDRNSSQFWDDLEKAIRHPRPLAEVLAAGDAAHGLAHNHFYGLLKVVAEKLPQGIKDWHSRTSLHLEKLLLIMPKSCKIPNDLTEYDKAHVSQMPECIPLDTTRVGQEREYRVMVYCVTDPRNPEEKFYVPMMTCSSTDHLRKMHEKKDSRYTLTEEEMYHQRHVMEARLDNLVQCSSTVKNLIRVVPYDDMSENGQSFSELVVETVR